MYDSAVANLSRSNGNDSSSSYRLRRLLQHVNQSMNQSKFNFRVITENYNVINALALERQPEKHYAH